MMDRKTLFRSEPMIESFLGVLLQDLQFTENDEACEDEREARDVGTIYDCPEATLHAAIVECRGFHDQITDAVRMVPDGALAGLDVAACAEMLGSDLYLERAGHGAGFRDHDVWSDDRDECNAIGEALSDLVKSGLETYLGDDGKAYVCGSETL